MAERKFSMGNLDIKLSSIKWIFDGINTSTMLYGLSPLRPMPWVLKVIKV